MTPNHNLWPSGSKSRAPRPLRKPSQQRRKPSEGAQLGAGASTICQMTLPLGS